MKKCYCCKELKYFVDFSINRTKSDGYATECKICKRLQDKNSSPERKEKARIRSSLWYYENREKALLANKPRSAKWAIDNKDKNCAKSAKYRASKYSATPPWLTIDDLKQIEIEYSLAQWTSSVMNSVYHVDHIIPLQGKLVCGLHVPWNLQVIPAVTNISKGNRIVL